jgi:hypothetical protein
MGNQNARIRAHLEAGHSITPLDALELFGCLRLSARIYDLKADGLKIASIPTTVAGGKVISTYRLLHSTPIHT